MTNFIDRELAQRGWKWKVRLTYNKAHARFGRWVNVGDLAIETLHKDDNTKNMEVKAAEARGDVDIEIIQIGEET